MYISVKTLKNTKISPYVDIIFLTNFLALISSVELLDFYNKKINNHSTLEIRAKKFVKNIIST